MAVLRYGPVAASVVLEGDLTLDDPDLAGLPGRMEAPTAASSEARELRFRRVAEGIEVGSGDSTAAAVPAPAVAGPVLAQLTRWLLADEEHWPHLHAAAFSLHGRAVVVAGTSGTGKTTLAVSAATTGAPVLNDEIVAVDREAGLVRAVARPLSVKPTGRSWIADATDLVPPGVDQVWWVDVEAIGGRPSDAAPPGIVLLAERRPGLATCRTVSRSTAVVHLIDHAFDVTVDPAGRLRDLAWLAASSQCVRLGYDDPTDALAALDGVASRPVEPGTVEALVDQEPTGAWMRARTVHSVVIDDRAVLHDERTGRVVALDVRGTALWRAIGEGAEDPRDRPFLDELVELGLLERADG